MHITEEVARKYPQLLGSFHQPPKHRVRVDFKHPGSGTNAQALSHACQHMDDDLPRHRFAMEDRAMRLQEVAFAGGALELTPWTTTGMAIGTQVAHPQPAAISTAIMGTKVPRGIDHTGAPVGWGH